MTSPNQLEGEERKGVEKIQLLYVEDYRAKRNEVDYGEVERWRRGFLHQKIAALNLYGSH
jgi:hypothetical protein